MAVERLAVAAESGEVGGGKAEAVTLQGDAMTHRCSVDRVGVNDSGAEDQGANADGGADVRTIYVM